MFAGAKGGGSSSFKQTPDNLRSNDTFEGVLGLGIGPFKGPTRGLKSIKVDGTAIENETGQSNFQDFAATLGDGDPLKFPQRVQLKLGAGAAPTQVGLSLPNDGGSNPIWITKTLANTNADFIDLRFIVQQLFRQDAKGIYTANATIEIQMKPTGSTTWINPTIGSGTGQYQEQGFNYDDGFGGLLKQYVARSLYDQNGYYAPQSPNFVISGKTSSPAVYELRLAVPNTGPYANTSWDIRCRLLERESYTGGKDNADQEKRQLSWESMAAVYSKTLGEHEDWRGVAWLQLYGKASDQLTGVPEITGEYDTKIIKVPANVFNPDTRQYTGGVWDGSWAKAFTTDPAWIINDAISDELSGISLIAPGSYLNKWDALDLSKYCSTLVPDGAGGMHPRYSLNLAISQPQKAEEFVRYLAGAVGALAWDQGDGEWRVKVDKADAPVDLFTLDNIEDQFIYSHTDVDTRFNDIIGKFKNAEMDYREDGVQLFDNPSIALIGRKPTTIALVGCTNRQEAMRRVKLRLRSTVNENRIVTFTTNRRGRNIEQLSTILIADGDLGDMDKRTTGRTIAVAADRKSIVVRDPMYVAPGVAYTMRFTVPNPAYAPETAAQPLSADWTKPTVVLTRNVVNTSGQRGSVTTIYLDAALPDSIADNLSVALEATTLPTLPRLFRVTSVMPQDDGERISISAINIDTGKWDAADNVTNQDTVFQDLRGEVPAPLVIPDAPLVSLVRVPIEQGQQVNLQANWMRPSGAFVSGFRVRYGVNGGALQTAVERQQLTTWELPNAGPGIYTVEICTMDRRGGYSVPLTGTLEVTQALIDATQITYTGGETLEDMKPAAPGADVTGDNPSLDTKNVGGRPVQVVLGDIDDAKDGVAEVKSDVVSLYEIYGNTANSAANANAAAAAKRDAETARDASQGARDAAAAARDAAGNSASQSETSRALSDQARILSEQASAAAGGARDAAQAAKELASQQAGLADTARQQAQAATTAAQTAQGVAEQRAQDSAQSASNASGFATTAQGQATIATQKADAAGQSASIADARATSAATDAGKASISQQQAAQSEQNAAGAASAAAASQTLTTNARDAVADQFARSHPPTLDPSGRGAYLLPIGAIVVGPSHDWPQAYITQNAAGSWGVETYTRFAKLLPRTAGKRYRVTSWGFSYATNVRFALSLFSSPTENPADTNQYHGNISETVLPQSPYFFKLTGEFSTDDHPGVAYFDPRMLLTTSDSLGNNGVIHTTGLVLEDITSEFAAAGSAAASLASSQSAASSADLSGQRASASDSSRALAQTAAGQAETYRNQASQSVTDANGARDMATQQAGVATQAKVDAQNAAGASGSYRDQAQGFANAASGSAQTAQSEAGYAQQRASAAEASRQQADTARSSAEGARDTAVQARNDAQGSAASAASNAILTANAVEYAGTMASGELVRQPRFSGPNIGWTNWGAYSTGTDTGITPNVQFATFGNRDQLAYPDGARAIKGNWSGRVIRVRARMATFASAYPVAAGFWTYRADGSTHQLVGYGHAPAMVPARQGWTEVDYIWTIAGTNEAVSLNPFIQINNDGAPNGNPSDFIGYIEYISLTDITESFRAEQQANASSASAQSASASNDLAGQRAAAADTSRQQAETAKGLAESARSSAAQSASDASGSKSDAAQSASISAQARDTVRYTALTSMVSNFNMPDRDSYWSLNDGNDSRYYEAHNNETWGVYSVADGKYVNFAYQGSFFPIAGRKYQTVAEVKGWQPGMTLRVGPGLYGASRDGAPFSYDVPIEVTSPADGSFAVVKSPIFVAQDGQRLSPRLVVWRGQGYVRTVKLVDITEQEEAAASARASSDSAASASASNDQAGQRANAAETSRQQAQGYAGDALAYRNTAADYRNDAQGAASTAQSASGVAATARDDTTAMIEKLLPGFEQGLRYWNTDALGAPEMHPKGAGFSLNSKDCTFSPNGLLPKVVGRRYRASVWMYQWAYGGPNTPFVGLYWCDFDQNGYNFQYLGGGDHGPQGYNSAYTKANNEWTLLQSEYLVTDANQERIQPRINPLNMAGNGVVIAGWRFEDITSEWAARQQASAASGFSSAASASADRAGQQATAADGYRNQAQTAAGNADASRASAAQSASDALGSANSATTQANLSASARDASVAAFARSFPSTLDPIGRQAFWWPGNVIGPSEQWPQPYITELAAGQLGIGGEVYIRYRKLMPRIAGRRYRARAWFFTYATNVQAFLGLFGGNTDDPSTSYAYLGTMSNGGTPTRPPNALGQGSGFFELTGEWESDSHSVGFFDPRIVASTYDNGGGGSNNGVFHLTGLEITDITERTAAKGFANAAQSSSASASASNDQAGQRASAADGSRAAAETARGGAESARDTAVNARNDAQGASNSASSSASLAARSAMEASQVGSGNLVPKPTFIDQSKGGWDADLREFGRDTNLAGPGNGWFARFPNRDNLYYPFGQGIRKRWAGRTIRVRALMTSLETQYEIGAGVFGHNANGDVTEYIINRMPARTGWTWITSPAQPQFSDYYEYTFGESSSVVLINPWLQISNTAGDLGRGLVSYFEITDVTEQVKSQGFANAASQSAANAQASSDASGNSANTSRGYRDEAQAANNNAVASASNAQNYANQANASRAQAESYSIIASSYSSSSVNLNDKFALWTGGNPGDLPNNWIYWAAEGNYRISKTAGIGSQWGVYSQNDTPNVNNGFYQPNTKVWAGKWVMEATARLDANNWVGSGLTLHGVWNIDFAREADSNGVIDASGEGKIRTWSKMFTIDQTFVNNVNGGANFHAMHGWDGFGPQRDPRYMTWFMARLRPATQPEIDSGKVNSLEARVVTAEGTLADVKNRTEAYFTKEVVAGSAAAFISARAKDDNGNLTSNVSLGAQTFSVYNPSGANWVEALRIASGNALFTGGISASSYTLLSNGQTWRFQFAATTFYRSNGVAVTTPNFGALPKIEFGPCPVPLNTGEVYSPRADNLTNTGFTPALVISVPSTPSNQSVGGGSYSGSGPNFQKDLEGKPQAANGTYTVSVGGTASAFWAGGNTMPDDDGYVQVFFDVYALKNGAWQLVASDQADCSIYLGGTKGTKTGNWSTNNAYQMGAGVTAVGVTYTGRSGGTSAGINNLYGVTWQAAGSAAGERSATPNGEQIAITVRPQ